MLTENLLLVKSESLTALICGLSLYFMYSKFSSVTFHTKATKNHGSPHSYFKTYYEMNSMDYNMNVATKAIN